MLASWFRVVSVYKGLTLVYEEMEAERKNAFLGGGRFSYLGVGVSFRHSFGFVASFVASSIISNLLIECDEPYAIDNVYLIFCALSMSGILVFIFRLLFI